MSRRRHGPPETAVPDNGGPTLIVCRGGDCGSRRKHPDTDHGGQLRRFRAGLGESTIVVSSCLDACEHSNVVVVVPGADGERAGEVPTWIGGVNDVETTVDLVDWLVTGNPERRRMPALAEIGEFQPNRRSRHELAEVRASDRLRRGRRRT